MPYTDRITDISTMIQSTKLREAAKKVIFLVVLEHSGHPFFGFYCFTVSEKKSLVVRPLPPPLLMVVLLRK